MAQKVVLGVEEFGEVVDFINNQTVPFHNLGRGMKIAGILRGAQTMEITVLPSTPTVAPGSPDPNVYPGDQQNPQQSN